MQPEAATPTDVTPTPSVAPAVDTQEVTAPPVEPSTPTGSEAVTNTGDTKEQQAVPFERFQEVNNQAKETKAQLDEMNTRLEELTKAQTTTEEPALDPEAERMLENWAKSKGLVSNEDLQLQRAQLQAQQDVKELQEQYKDFDVTKVMEYADNTMGGSNIIKSKQALEATYIKMNLPAILEAERNKAVAESKSGGTYAETPGPGGQGSTPPEAKPASGDLKSLVANAYRKLKQ